MPAASQSEPGLILYQTEDGRTRLQCRLEDGTLWLSQVQLAELFETTVANINLHLKALYAEGELSETATIKSYLIVRSEGPRQVRRQVLHYRLEAILAVGYRVRSHRGSRLARCRQTHRRLPPRNRTPVHRAISAIDHNKNRAEDRKP